MCLCIFNLVRQCQTQCFKLELSESIKSMGLGQINIKRSLSGGFYVLVFRDRSGLNKCEKESALKINYNFSGYCVVGIYLLT